MNEKETNDWEKRFETQFGLEQDFHYETIRDFLSRELQRTRLETIEECEGVLPKRVELVYTKKGPRAPRNSVKLTTQDVIRYQKDFYRGFNSSCEETLKNLRALKEVTE